MKEQNILLWILTGIAALFFVMSALGNLGITLGHIFRKQKKSESLIPVVGGLAGFIGVMLAPVEGIRHYWWVPLIADVGCLPMTLCAIVEWVVLYPRRRMTDQPPELDGLIPGAPVSVKDRKEVEMFWKQHKREMRCYSISDQIAWEWPRMLVPLGFSVYLGSGWAKITSDCQGGCPWGDVSAADHTVQMGSLFLTEESAQHRAGNSPPGFLMHLAFKTEHEPLADQIDTILREHGATLVRSEAQ